MSTGRPPGSGKASGKAVGKAAATKAMATAQAKIERKLASKAAQQQKLERMAARKRFQVEALSEAASALELWTRDEPGARRPRFTRDQIAVAAVRIADADGFEALSMRRLATELGSGTMTLYHYVRTKDELLALVTDAVMAEVTLPEGETMPSDWREALTVLARRTRDTLTKHPWVLDIADDPDIGPNAVRHFDQTLAAVSGLSLPLEQRMEIAMFVDDYVFGYCMHARDEHPGGTHDHQTLAYVQDLVETGQYPQLQALAEEFGYEGAWARIRELSDDPDRFERNLKRLLDGIAASL